VKALVILKYNKLQSGSTAVVTEEERMNYNSEEFLGSLRTGYYLTY